MVLADGMRGDERVGVVAPRVAAARTVVVDSGNWWMAKAAPHLVDVCSGSREMLERRAVVTAGRALALSIAVVRDIVVVMQRRRAVAGVGRGVG